MFPNSPQDAEDAKLEAFTDVELFRQVAEHYGGSNLPEDEFVRNTLQTQFSLDPRVHDEFLDLFKKNAKFVGIGAEWPPPRTGGAPSRRPGAGVLGPSVNPPATALTSRATGNRPICFVIMPFVERTDLYATGFFNEVFASLFKPAIEAAGFEPKPPNARALT